MYEKAIVTFIDILGFSDLVKRSKPEAINKALDAVEQSTSPVILDDKPEKDDHAEVLSFSDSIVRIRKIETAANKKYQSGLLFQELISLVHVQGELIDFDIIIRGGVTIGDICFSKGRVFGPGLIDAYELESKYALYPRIVINPCLIQEYKTNKLLKATWHTLEDEFEIVGSLLKQGDDGMWFIDYATALEQELDEQEMYPIFLRRHKEVILSGAKNHVQLNSVLRKFVWMANYHNQIVNGLRNEAFERYDLDKDDFLIKSQEIPALQYLEP